ncbi:AraC family transcriptional regulator [Desertihabitans brevis]|uniref:AraC family transcriptional regulator n=1 Tax=Desertihabitans brevis TaxID=2268447 RepID=A0A367YXS6_9ACTN|nr:helix-turn-helix transcriptional regulator [Desertihabitans brevis]RCK70664.1 AraC family transcriptional regulator [Desertihabitans brevis]
MSSAATLRLPRVRVATGTRVARYRPGAVFGPRRLADFELTWLLTGSARLRYQARDEPLRTVPLRPGLLNLSREGTVDCYLWDEQTPSTHAYLHFDLVDPGTLPPPARWPAVRDLTVSPVLGGLCQHLLDLGSTEDAAAQEATGDALALLLDIFVRPGPGTGEGAPAWLEGLVDSVAVRWADTGICRITTDQLAEAVGVSRGYLTALVSRQFGCGPAQLVELVRLAHGAVALHRSNATVEEVARSCGYATPFHFSHRFRHVYGMPPGRFRRTEPRPDPYGPVREHGLLPVARRLLQVSTIG